VPSLQVPSVRIEAPGVGACVGGSRGALPVRIDRSASGSLCGTSRGAGIVERFKVIEGARAGPHAPGLLTVKAAATMAGTWNQSFY
jgi:hypothetical protein